jgi:hypothetical protein
MWKICTEYVDKKLSGSEWLPLTGSRMCLWVQQGEVLTDSIPRLLKVSAQGRISIRDVRAPGSSALYFRVSLCDRSTSLS